MLTPEIKLANARLLQAFEPNAPEDMVKTAAKASTDFIRTKLMEDSFYRKILPQEPITDADLDNSLVLRKPRKIIEKEPNSTGAMTVQYGTLPNQLFLEGDKFPVYFNRIVTQQYVKDVGELRTWKMDLRQVMLDQQMKWIAEEEDRRFIDGVNAAITLPFAMGATNTCQWYTLQGGMSRENMVDALAVMCMTRSRLNPKTVLINQVTAREIIKWGRDEVGGDFAQKLLLDGWQNEQIMGVRWLVTIKRELVPDGRMYMFADPKYIGKHYVLDDVTMYVKNEAYFVSWFLYKEAGGAIGNISGLAAADFNPQGLSNDRKFAGIRQVKAKVI